MLIQNQHVLQHRTQIAFTFIHPSFQNGFHNLNLCMLDVHVHRHIHIYTDMGQFECVSTCINITVYHIYNESNSIIVHKIYK